MEYYSSDSGREGYQSEPRARFVRELHRLGNPLNVVSLSQGAYETEEELIEFADRYRLTIARDSCGDPVLPGRLGRDSNISEFSDTGVAVCWLPDGKRTGLWNITRKRCLAAGMRLHQEGDAEGIFVFDPVDTFQAKTAIKCVKAKVKRRITPERVIALSKTLLARSSKTLSGTLGFELETRAGLTLVIYH